MRILTCGRQAVAIKRKNNHESAPPMNDISLTTPSTPCYESNIDSRFPWTVAALVSGTCIGGGMLAMPVETAKAGFLFSIFGITLCWAFMTYTGLLLVEATLWVKNETHFCSLTHILIGPKTRLLALLVYLFMNYASLVAYTAGGAALLQHHAPHLFGNALSYESSCILFTLVFGSIIYLGARFVGNLNLLCMIALGVIYCWLVSFGLGHIDIDRLGYRPVSMESLGIYSIILATFSYQMVVPSLCLQLNYNAPQLKKAIIVGTTIPFVIYSIWLLVVHGITPLEGENGLLSALERGASATEPMRAQFQHWSLSICADLFAFFAIVTSYMGLSLALFYFLKDGFSELKISLSRNAIILASIIPTLLLAMKYPQALVRCLNISGGYGDTILSGLIPIAMVWMGRYKKGTKGALIAPGGKGLLLLAAAFYLFIFALQWIPS